MKRRKILFEINGFLDGEISKKSPIATTKKTKKKKRYLINNIIISILDNIGTIIITIIGSLAATIIILYLLNGDEDIITFIKNLINKK